MVYVRPLPVEVRRKIEADWNGTKITVGVSRYEDKPSKSFKGLDQVAVKPRFGKKPNRGYEEGIAAEERFFRLCETLVKVPSCPRWFTAVTRGTVRDDGKGIDAHAHITIVPATFRKIPVQIKSSARGRDKFRAQSRYRHIICIVVDEQRGDKEIFAELVEELAFVYEALQKKYAGALFA